MMTQNRSPRIIRAFATLWVGILGWSGCAEPAPPLETDDLAATVCPGGATVLGIDVSYYQGTINWPSVANDGVEFAFIRVSDGLTYYDSQFQSNWVGAANAGLYRGAYQYFRPAQDPVDQANLLIDEINLLGGLQAGDLPPVIDVETDDNLSAAAVVNGIQLWLDQVESAFGVPPIIYTSSWAWSSYAGSSTQFTAYPMWAASWTYDPNDCPYIPDPWSDWEFWQYSDSGSVNGISGAVDLNLFNGDGVDLDDYAVGEAACAPVPFDGRIIDELDDCFESGGNPDYWYTASAGYDGALAWTHTTDDVQVDDYGVWNLEFDVAGAYLVEAYTDAAYAESLQASYQIQHAGTADIAVIAQSAVDGWNPLGTFEFAAGGGQWIRLNDNTGEPFNGGETQLVFDAIQLTPEGDDDDTADDDDSSDDDASDDDASNDEDSSDDDTSVDDAAAHDSGDLDDPFDSLGCQCGNGRSGVAPAGLWMMLGLALAVCRRGRWPAQPDR